MATVRIQLEERTTDGEKVTFSEIINMESSKRRPSARWCDQIKEVFEALVLKLKNRGRRQKWRGMY